MFWIGSDEGIYSICSLKEEIVELKNAVVEMNKEFSKAAEVNISSSNGPGTWLGRKWEGEE